jgi:uncharacterized membrane protein
MSDTARRSLAKTITWRVLGSTSTFTIAYLITGRWDASSAIAVIQMIINTFLYLFHERAWAKIGWGRTK